MVWVTGPKHQIHIIYQCVNKTTQRNVLKINNSEDSGHSSSGIFVEISLSFFFPFQHVFEIDIVYYIVYCISYIVYWISILNNNNQHSIHEKWKIQSEQNEYVCESLTSSASLAGATYDFLGTFGGVSGCKIFTKLLKSCCGDIILHWFVRLS